MSKSQMLVCIILRVGVHVLYIYVKQKPLLVNDRESIAAEGN